MLPFIASNRSNYHTSCTNSAEQNLQLSKQDIAFQIFSRVQSPNNNSAASFQNSRISLNKTDNAVETQAATYVSHARKTLEVTT